MFRHRRLPQIHIMRYDYLYSVTKESTVVADDDSQVAF